MNYERILRVTNYFLILCGYQLHIFQTKSRRYRLSLMAILNFTIIALFYAICFNQHFERSGLLKLLKDVSPFLRNLVQYHVVLGLKVLLFGLYELRVIIRIANGLADMLPRVFAHKFCRQEAFVYFLLFSTFIISLGFLLYIAIEMEFILPPMDHILIWCALFIPHFVLAGALKFFNIATYLMREELKDLEMRFSDVYMKEEPHTNSLELVEQNMKITNSVSSTHITAISIEKLDLSQICTQLEILSKEQKLLNDGIQKQLTILIALNINCLLAGVYSLVYFESNWHILFVERKKRIFHAANYAIYVLIFWDYLCLCLTQTLFAKTKCSFQSNVQMVLKQRNRCSKQIRYLVKSIRDLLTCELNFNIFGVLNLTTWNFLMVQKFVGLVIALIVIYHYLNDEIISLINRLDELETNEE